MFGLGGFLGGGVGANPLNDQLNRSALTQRSTGAGLTQPMPSGGIVQPPWVGQAPATVQPQVGAEQVQVDPAAVQQGPPAALVQPHPASGFAAPQRGVQPPWTGQLPGQVGQGIDRFQDRFQSARDRILQGAHARAEDALAKARGGVQQRVTQFRDQFGGTAGGGAAMLQQALGQSPFGRLIGGLPDGSALRERLQLGRGRLHGRLGGEQ